MKITINDKKEIAVRKGDFILIKDKQDIMIRQIINCTGKYIAIEVDGGGVGFTASSIEGLIMKYEEVFTSVEIVKNSEVELIIRGGQEENV